MTDPKKFRNSPDALIPKREKPATPPGQSRRARAKRGQPTAKGGKK